MAFRAEGEMFGGRDVRRVRGPFFFLGVIFPESRGRRYEAFEKLEGG